MCNLYLLSDHSDEGLASTLERLLVADQLISRVERRGAFNPFLEARLLPVHEVKDSLVYLNLSTQGLRERFLIEPPGEHCKFAANVAKEVAAAGDALLSKGARLLCNTFAVPLERQFGNFSIKESTSFATQVRRLNVLLADWATSQSSVWMVDIEHLSARLGLISWFDERFWFHAKYPCKPGWVKEWAIEVATVIRALSGRLIKALVLDLDNTLWGGVIGDDGLEGIRLGGVGEGEAFQYFQRYLKTLQERGLLLAVCSKNEDAAARLPFVSHDAMILKENDFVAFQANWQPKSTNLKAIAQTLNIGLDSLLFLDDSPFERAEVREQTPEVKVIDLPTDPAGYVAAIEGSRLLETAVPSTQEDSRRTDLYRTEGQRRRLESTAGSHSDFLASLNMRGRFYQAQSSDLARMEQLIQRSNQFNLRTQRLTRDRLLELSINPKALCACCTLEDRFGDYGLISAICGHLQGSALVIEEFVMSCRVLSRGVEEFILNGIVLCGLQIGATHIIGEYLPTPKNTLVKELFSRLGFNPRSESPNQWQLDLDTYQSRPTLILPLP